MPDINNLGKLLSLKQQIPAVQIDGVFGTVLAKPAVSAALDRFEDFIDGQILLPLEAVLRIIAGSRFGVITGNVPTRRRPA